MSSLPIFRFVTVTGNDFNFSIGSPWCGRGFLILSDSSAQRTEEYETASQDASVVALGFGFT